MIKVHILVEGQTEEEFVRGILHEHFYPKNIHLNPIIIKTRQAIGGSPSYRGGIVSFEKIRLHLNPLIWDTSVSLVTTMIDFYQLPANFPGFNDDEAKKGSSRDCVNYLETKFRESIDHPKFLPYISLHEFEALLFSDTDTLVREVRADNKKAQTALQKIKNKYPSPEEINKDYPPSRHILEHLSEYDKVLHGYLIAIEIGIEKMRQHCPHFHEWLTIIEALATK